MHIRLSTIVGEDAQGAGRQGNGNGPAANAQPDSFGRSDWFVVQQQFLSKLSVEYIETRYPDELHALDEFNTRQAAEEHLREPEALFKWLETQTK